MEGERDGLVGITGRGEVQWLGHEVELAGRFECWRAAKFRSC